jgi:hypothetical protein
VSNFFNVLQDLQPASEIAEKLTTNRHNLLEDAFLISQKCDAGL